MSAETLDTDLIPKVIGRAQSRAVSYDEEGEAIRARQQFGALLERLRRLEAIGSQMSNVCFNLSQREGSALEARTCKTMDELRRDWDEAIRS